MTLLSFAVALASAGAVNAQPAASPSPAASPPGRPANPLPPPATENQASGVPPAVRPARPMSHFPLIDVVVNDTEPAYTSVPSQMRDYQALSIGGTVRIPITKAFSASYDRVVGGGLNSAQEIQNLGAVKPGNIHDVIQVFRLDESLKRFNIEEGLSFRHRMWNDGGGGVSAAPYPYTVSSTEHHFAYLGVTYSTPPIVALLHSTFVFNVTGQAQNVDHHVAACNTGGAGPGGWGCKNGVRYIDEAPGTDRWYEASQSVAAIVPIGAKSGTTLLLKDEWGAGNFYEASHTPFFYTGKVLVQLRKKFNNFFSLSLSESNLHGREQGVPFPRPAVIHPQWFNITADFHLDTAKLLAH